jgi:hypothetical protein
MASPDTLKALLEALEAERARRRKAQLGGHDDPRQWFLDTLQTIAQRFAAAASSRYPLQIDDMSPVEQLACHLLADELRPVGLGTVDEIWAAYEARK